MADPPQRPHLTVVGIGASAGGLAALRTFFSEMPAQTGCSFVVIVHLAPDHESHLADLLQPHVPFRVTSVTETVELEPDRVYVIPPNANLDAIDTHLRLSELPRHGRNRSPIDHFFRTLASTHDGHAVGVVLTGTGSDGALGIKAIREMGGLTIVQSPDEAEYASMPSSAIATGLVDIIAPLSAIPRALLRFAGTRPRVADMGEEDEVDRRTHHELQKIFAQVRARTGRDFSRYKRSTLLRRIARRMQMAQISDTSDYIERLRSNPEEVKALSEDLLVTVTSFFRDPEVFECLARDVIPGLFDHRGPGDTVRIWTVGCATGEEAYSLAMILLEEASRRENPPLLQIFASDLHEPSIERAREGVYAGDIEADVTRERLDRFFKKEDHSYRVRSELREIVVFASHNLLSDPPFSHLDMVTCRNLLIYLDRDVQREVLELFHYSLRSGGVLVAGASETVDRSELFSAANKALRIYGKRDVPTREPRLPVFSSPRPVEPRKAERNARAPGRPVTYGDMHERMVELYAPPSVLIAPDDRVVHFSEHAGRFLLHPGGAPTESVYKMVREELRAELRLATASARRSGTVYRSRPIIVRFNGESSPVVLEVRPAHTATEEGFALVLFDTDTATATTPAPAPKDSLSERDDELENLRLRLQTLSEQYESSQEEMRASNEELQSANEELRSTLEELETSKEELLSINEELQTVNQENRHKVDELAQLSGDLSNLLAATNIATLFLDRDFRILRFTPQLGELFNVRLTDRGRPLSDITHRLGYPGLMDDARSVLAKLIPIEREVQDDGGSWYLTRVLPYRSTTDRIEGIVITFIDITGHKRDEDALVEAKHYAEQVVETLPGPLLVLTSDLRVRSANTAFYQQFLVSPHATLGRRIYDLGNGQWNIPALRKLLEEVLPDDHVLSGYQVDHEFESLGPRTMMLNARRLDRMELILLGILDVTEAQTARRELAASEARLRDLVRASSDVVYRMSADWSEMIELEGRGFLPDALEPTRDWLSAYVEPADRPGVMAAIQEAVRTKDMFQLEHRVRRSDGRVAWARSRAIPVFGVNGELREWFGAATDITARREAGAAEREPDPTG